MFFFVNSRRAFLWARGKGAFRPRHPLFLILWILTSVRGKRIPHSFPSNIQALRNMHRLSPRNLPTKKDTQKTNSSNAYSIQKSLGVHKILVRKIWFYPPPPRKRAQKEEKLYKSVENPQSWHFFGGGGDAILWTKRFYGHLGVSEAWVLIVGDSPKGPSRTKNISDSELLRCSVFIKLCPPSLLRCEPFFGGTDACKT